MIAKFWRDNGIVVSSKIPEELFEAAAAEAKKEMLGLYNQSETTLLHSG